MTRASQAASLPWASVPLLLPGAGATDLHICGGPSLTLPGVGRAAPFPVSQLSTSGHELRRAICHQVCLLHWTVSASRAPGSAPLFCLVTGRPGTGHRLGLTISSPKLWEAARQTSLGSRATVPSCLLSHGSRATPSQPATAPPT